MALHIFLEGSLSNRRGETEPDALAKGGGGCEFKKDSQYAAAEM